MEEPMGKPLRNLLISCVFAGLLIGYTKAESAESVPPDVSAPKVQPVQALPSGPVFESSKEATTIHPQANAARNAYFGDLHVHTTYSFDAFAFGTLATPYDAYRYAKGEAIKHPAGFSVKLRQPLDFYAVTDHAMFLGMVPAAADTTTDLSKLDMYKPLHNLNAPENLNVASIGKRGAFYATFIPQTIQGLYDGTVDMEMALEIVHSAWIDTIRAAEEYNDPGKFTTFIAYEYTTGSDDRGNLHRNVIFKGNDKVPAIPFSRFHSQNPEGLWDWMDDLREQGIESMAIPHNSNGSNGQMFKLVDWAGNPMDDSYADQRMRNEPIVEITQVKGTSDTHPALSPNDEWADFEIMPYRIGSPLPSEPLGSYVRNALQRGLSMEDKGGVNPYKFGFIGSSDTHTAAISDDESNFFSKVGLLDGNGVQRGSLPLPKEQAKAMRDTGATNIVTRGDVDYINGSYQTWGASGLAGVWAEENTRDAIYNAFRRKETFATSGPRIRVRFFAGFDFTDDMMAAKDMVTQAYTTGVTMGNDLLAVEGKVPQFLAWAIRDANSAALQRLQIVKGWIANGTPKEKIYDVLCSDGLAVDPTTHRCPDNGAKVNLADCSITANVGNAELKALWKDPDFDADQRAFYYVRVLENPTCRWSTWDAVRAGVPPRPDLKKTIQERAWSSPIWYAPLTLQPIETTASRYDREPSLQPIETTTFKYDGEPSFRIEFPEGTTRAQTDAPDQGFAATTPDGVAFQANVADIPPGGTLEEAAKHLAAILESGGVGSDIKITSNVEIELKDGTRAYRSEIRWFHTEASVRIMTQMVSAYRDGKMVYVAAHPLSNPNLAISILESLRFD
jgi:hypothetical protein